MDNYDSPQVDAVMNHRGIDDKRRKEICGRLTIAISRHPKYRTFKQGQLATLLHVKAQSVSLWLNGERLPSVEHCIAWADVLKISLDWLLLGIGEMRLSPTVKGETVVIGAWPDHAKDVVRGMAMIFDDEESTAKPKE